MSELEFAELLKRVRANDHDAIEELLRQYEPLVQREIRIGMIRSPLRRVIDSIDITQSVWYSFFVHAAAGDYELLTSNQLRALLVTMARNKLASHFRKHHRAKRSIARTEAKPNLDLLAVRTESPIETVEAREIVEHFNRKLSNDEREIASLRKDGCSWAEVASFLGGTAQGRRMQLSRAIDRIALELGIGIRQCP